MFNLIYISMKKFKVTQEWNTTCGWTVAERIMHPKHFSIITTSMEEAQTIFVETASAMKHIAKHQKNASMSFNGTAWTAGIGRNGRKDEITIKVERIK